MRRLYLAAFYFLFDVMRNMIFISLFLWPAFFLLAWWASYHQPFGYSTVGFYYASIGG